MLVLEVVAALLLLLVVPFAAIVVRRRVLQRGGGTIELSLRLRRSSEGRAGHGRGWVLGIGRFEGDELRWYRVFSLAPGPRRRLSRRELQVTGRREPTAGEAMALLSGAVVMECTSPAGEVALAMDAAAVTGFLAWLEAAPPGAGYLAS